MHLEPLLAGVVLRASSGFFLPNHEPARLGPRPPGRAAVAAAYPARRGSDPPGPAPTVGPDPRLGGAAGSLAGVADPRAGSEPGVGCGSVCAASAVIWRRSDPPATSAERSSMMLSSSFRGAFS